MSAISFYSTPWQSKEVYVADQMPFVLNAHEVEKYLAWRAEVEAATGQPLTGLYISFVLTTHGLRQIIVRPSTDADLKLHNIPREDGTLDHFVPHEKVLTEGDTFGFATTSLPLRDVGLRLHCCHWSVLGRETTPRCYVECMNDPHQPLLPYRVSDAPELLEEDIVLKVFPYTPLPPVLHQRVVAFIRTNVTPLLQHWYGGTSSFELLEALQEPSDDEALPP
jgi:hypothetical protein